VSSDRTMHPRAIKCRARDVTHVRSL
jgi:hypothetical protein